MMLNFIFLLHAALSLLVAFFLVFFTQWFTSVAIPAFPWPSAGTMLENVLFAYARLAGAGLVLLAFAASRGGNSEYSVVRREALFSMVVISVVLILVALSLPTPLPPTSASASAPILVFEPLKTVLLWINVAFAAAYGIIWYFYQETV